MKTLIGFVLAIAWFAASTACAAPVPRPLTDFAGRWAVRAEGRNVMVVALEYDSNAHQLHGGKYRPLHMSLSESTASSVTLPVVEEKLVGADPNSDGVRLYFRDPDGTANDWHFELDGTDAATLKLTGTSSGLPAGFPDLVYHLFRVGADASVATDWDPGRAYALDQPGATDTDNPNMTRLFEEDQSDRKSTQPINWKEVGETDAERRRAAAAMLRGGALHTGMDFYHAAFVFQHGGQPNDYLLAHALALAALAKGRVDAGWIAAATLDRYLHSTGKPQIYGTQFLKDGQDPYDRDLIPDTLRQQMGVPAIVDQHTPPLRIEGSAQGCADVAGEAALWSNPKIRFVLTGEFHGTQEEPALYADIVCAASASGRPIVAALELSENQQPAIDAFLASDGGDTAQQAFLKSDHWHMSMRDGRSSKAYLGLFERLRVLKKIGRIVGVEAIQAVVPMSKGSPNEGNAEMADLIEKVGSLRPDTLVLVLVGEFHARKEPVTIGTQTIIPAAADLPPDETLSLRFMGVGEAWNCQNGDCSVHPLSGPPPARREIRLGAGAPPGFDGIIALGTKATASLPAVAE